MFRYIVLALSLTLSSNLFASTATQNEVVKHYITIAHAMFSDALSEAKKLEAAIEKLIQNPSENALVEARQAWIKARVPYQQTEALRFGNSIVDDWEGQVNAWPLDEGLIDYVSDDYAGQLGNEGAYLNIIGNQKLQIAGEELDVSNITPQLLADLNEFAGSEANVTTGYHAVEFLLWGQDLHGTEPGAGERPYTDYSTSACSNGNCDRRAAYLKAVMKLLLNDLEYMTGQWDLAKPDSYANTLLKTPAKEVITKVVSGLGALSLGELAGERIKVALEANSPEDEHDCFSDNTHNSHYYNALGIKNIFFGTYTRVNGKTMSGSSIYDLVSQGDKETASQAQTAFDNTIKAMQVLVAKAESTESPMKVDQMIAEGNKEGKKILADVVEALVVQTNAIAASAKAIGLTELNQ